MCIYKELFRNMGKPIIPTLFVLLMTILSGELAPSSGKSGERPRVLTGSSSAAYNFPFICSVHGTIQKNVKNVTLGSCSILNEKYALFAVDLFDRFITHFRRAPVDYADLIYVYAGSSSLNPYQDEVSTPDARDDSAAIQMRKVSKVIIGRRERFDEHKVFFVYNPDDYYPVSVNPFLPMNESVYARNALGELENDVGLLEFRYPLFWSPYVLPMPLAELDLIKLIANFERTFTLRPESLDNCVIAGWGPHGNNQLMFHELINVPFFECIEALCGQVPSTCLKYPIRYYHECFKSPNYGDVCTYDQGSAVYCPKFNKSVYAILVKSFDCGLTNLPAIYTILPFAAEIYSRFRNLRAETHLRHPIKYTDYRIGSENLHQPVTLDYP